MSKPSKSKSILWHQEYLLKPEMKHFYTTSPGAPSLGECKIIEKFIAQKKKYPKILILGATPRYRDLGHRLKAEVTCVDISIDMFQSMISLMKNKKITEKEIWVKSDWLKAPLQKNYWDFILGDLVIPNLPIKLWQPFLLKMKNLIKLGGYFITRQLNQPSIPYPSSFEIMNRFQARKKYEVIELNWELLRSITDRESNEMRTDDLIREVRLAINSTNKKLKNKFKKMFKDIQDHYPTGKIWYALTKKDFEKMLRRYFKISAIRYGNDYPYTKDCPIYFLNKK